MIAKNYISDSLPFIRLEDTGYDALELMETFKVSHLPLVDNGNYIRLISEDDIYEYNLEEKNFSQVNLPLYRPFVYENQNIFDLLVFLVSANTTVIPVLSDKNIYQGAIISYNLLLSILPMFGLDREGAVFAFKIKKRDYSVTKIGSIVEANSSKILGLFTRDIDNEYMQLIIKVDTPEVTSLMQTFERYDFEVEALLYDDQEYKKLYQERLDAFLKYLSI